MNWFNKIWKDPVLSNVIAGVIITIIGFIIKPHITFLSHIPWWIYIVFLLIIIILVIVLLLKFQYNENTKKVDKKTFDKITKEMLPSNSVIDFVRSQAFGSSFRAERLNLLDEFEYTKNDPHLRFINPKLEDKRKELLTSISNFKNVLLRVTSVNEHGIQSMLPNIHSDPNKSTEICRELGELADAICFKYDELVSIGKENGF